MSDNRPPGPEKRHGLPEQDSSAMSILITDAPKPKPGNAPKKKVFGVSAGVSSVNTARAGIYEAQGGGLQETIERVSKGSWYTGDPTYPQLLDSYTDIISGEKSYGTKVGNAASFGFLGHLARRLPAPVMFDDPKIAQFIFGSLEAATAAVDTAGRMWVYGPFFEQLLQEEVKNLRAVLPLMLHEYSHVALNHTRRLHMFPSDIANIAADKVINPMVKVYFGTNTLSQIISMAHGLHPRDAHYADKAEETIARMLLDERRKATEDLGTIRIKNLVIKDGAVRAITTLSAGKGEVKDYDTVNVTVQDLGMMDKISHIFDCATLEIDNIDNQLATRNRPGAGAPGQKPEDAPIMIPTKSDNSASGDSDIDNPARQSLDDVKNAAQGKGKGAAGKADPSAGQQDPGQQDGGGQGPAQGGGKPSQGSSAGSASAGADASAAGQADGQSPGNASQNSPINAPSADAGAKGRSDPRSGSGAADPNAAGASPSPAAASPAAQGTPADVLSDLGVRDSPLDGGNHMIDSDALGAWLEANGHEALVEKMRPENFHERDVERAIEVSMAEASKERLLIGSGYAGGHMEDYITTVVKPSSIYKVSWQSRITDMIMGEGISMVSTIEEYHALAYTDPEDMGMPADDQLVFPGHVQQKPEGLFFVIVDTSGSVWADMRRLGHFLSFAVGIRANSEDLSPDIIIAGADTVVTGKPHNYDNESILEAIETGVPLGGGGGTDFTTPINQAVAWAVENDQKINGIIYVTDFEAGAPDRDQLPEQMPPLMWVGMPHDYARASSFIKAVESYSEVIVMDNDMSVDFGAAQDKALDNLGRGHQNIRAA